jgi:pimeloyl-ACP methyl ester carboxylesterase
MIVRRLARWKRIAVSRLSLRYPAFLRFLPTPRPLAVRAHPYDGPSPSRDLLVCLPGIGDEANDFADHGFVDLVRAHRWPADVLLVDAHYRAIWLVGISMGGLGALLYASRHPTAVRGVVAIAPFLGRHTLVREIYGAGGLARWTSTVDPADEISALWSWVRDHSHWSPASPEIFLAFGDTDIFAEAHRLLASSLPAANVVTVFGGHRWPVWLDLWKRFLDRHMARETELG